MRIRAAEPDDAAVISDLLRQLGYPSPAEEIPARLGLVTETSNGIAVVAEEKGRVVGMATARCFNAIHTGEPIAYLTTVVVDASVRRSGAGRELVRTMELWARGRGATMLRLTSGLHRSEAHEFYRRMGFRQTGLRFGKPLE